MNLIDRLCTNRQQRKQIAAARTRLYRVALAWCGDAMLADDLAQEAVSLGLQKIHQLREPERLNAWLYSILNNCWKTHLRRQRPHEDLDDEIVGDTPAAEVSAGRLETVQRVRSAVARLPLDQRRVLSLVDLEGMAYCEVAEVLDVPIGTVMSRLHRGRRALLGLLENTQRTQPVGKPALRRVK